MSKQTRKMSEILKEMADQLFKDPGAVPSSEAAHVALMFANIAWNETIGLDHPREAYRSAWEVIEAMWCHAPAFSRDRSVQPYSPSARRVR